MDETKKECPSCAMEIENNTRICPICGYEFPQQHSSWIVALAIILVLVFVLFYIF